MKKNIRTTKKVGKIRNNVETGNLKSEIKNAVHSTTVKVNQIEVNTVIKGNIIPTPQNPLHYFFHLFPECFRQHQAKFQSHNLNRKSNGLSTQI